MLSELIQVTATEQEQERINNSLRVSFGIENVWQILCNFSEFSDIMRGLGYVYDGCDYQNECHIFKNGRFEFRLFPVCFYEKQGFFRVFNINVMWS